MSAILHPWLGDSIEREVGIVLDWRCLNNANKSQRSGEVGGLRFDDDANILRVRSPKPQVLQVAKVRKVLSFYKMNAHISTLLGHIP